MSVTVEALRRPDGRIAVRARHLIVPTVSCANGVCESLNREFPDTALIRHQHGCGQLDGDIDLTRAVLVGHIAHPNVDRTLLVSLGCETNQPRGLLAAAGERGLAPDVVGIQQAGGAKAAVDAGHALLSGYPEPMWAPETVSSREIRLGLIGEGTAADAILPALRSQLEAAGFELLHVEPLQVAPRPSAAGESGVAGVPGLWRQAAAPRSETLAALVAQSSQRGRTLTLANDLIRRITTLVAAGAHAVIVVTDRPMAIGSPVAPLIKVSATAANDALHDLFDITSRQAGGLELVSAVLRLLGGEATASERIGARDFAMPRTAPFL